MIYLLEDETPIRKLILYTLENSDYETEGFDTVSSFWEGMTQQLPDLILLDIMLPDGSGLDVLEQLKKSGKTSSIPVMMLSAMGTEYDKVLGFDTGADDYLPKPFGLMELLARVKNLLRRHSSTSTTVEEYQFDNFFVSIPQHLVTVEKNPINLTLKEFDVLTFLLRHQNIVLTREQIMTGVWGYDFDGESRTVDVHIRTLRSKIGTYSSVIETVRGVGYKIAGEL